MWVKFKNWLIKVAVKGLVKAGKAELAKEICKSIIKDIDEQTKK